MKKFKIISLMLVVIFVLSALSTSVFAADSWTAVKPTYKTFVNGVEVSGMEVMNINDRTYLGLTSLYPFGIGNNSETFNGVAYFTIPKKVSTGYASIKKLTQNEVMFYNGSNIKGNGVFVNNKTQILTTVNAWNSGSIVVRNYKNSLVSINPVPLQINDRFVLLKTTGAENSTFATLADKRAEVGEDVALISSMNGNQNMINIAAVADYKDFNNILVPGQEEYLRTYNNSNQTQQGGGLYDESGKLCGIMMYKGPNYTLFATLEDIKDFLD